MSRVKAILFDMDGVLIDAKDWHYDALNQALSVFGYEIGREAHLSTFDGLPTRRKLEILSQSSGLPTGLHAFINQLKQSYTIQISHQRCHPVFSHQYALRRLKDEGYKLAVCSNSIRNTVETLMHLSGLDEYLDVLISNEDVVHAKPSPDMYLLAMEKFGLRPDECLILEDNDHGIQAAIASGAHLFIVSDPSDVTYTNIRRNIDQAVADKEAC
ncbi:HAD family hydrolase [Agrobacterium salinitolerans]|uniref:HAD family hydrolase n=1 Tax=Agrobacterium salinitolerans TaxID=1183413 RepID=UPI001748D09B